MHISIMYPYVNVYPLLQSTLMFGGRSWSIKLCGSHVFYGRSIENMLGLI